MIPITDIIKSETEKYEKAKSEAKRSRTFIKIEYEDFKKLIIININRIIISRNIFRNFELNTENEKIIKQLYYHLTGNDKFKGDISKGIMLVGKNGVGKTIILGAYCNVRAIFWGKHQFVYHSKKLLNYIKERGFNEYSKKELMIDDLGKESLEINDFGNKIQPIADLISFRYDNGALTFATCNYKTDTLTDFYGLTTTDRFKEMFNIIELKGESFRK